MKASWQSESGGLLCRWSDLLEGDRSKSSITPEASTGINGSFLPLPPDFAAHSLLGSGEWYVPWNFRWSVPRPCSEATLSAFWAE
jgi:hypothetical protein